MSLASKHYYLFGWRIWSVIVETQADDVEEDDDVEVGLDHKLDGSQTLSSGDTPMFGFTPWTPHWITEDEE